jgi:hypothetical protein
MHVVYEQNLDEFYETYLERLSSAGYLALVLAIVREADAPGFYEDVLRYWTSLHDLTGQRIVFAVAAPSVADRVNEHQYIGSNTSTHLVGKPGILRSVDNTLYRHIKEFRNREFNHPFLPQSSKPRCTEGDFADANTLQITRLSAKLGLSERQLPCLHLTIVMPGREMETAAIEFRAFERFSIYTVCKELVAMLDPDLRALAGVREATEDQRYERGESPLESLDRTLALLTQKLAMLSQELNSVARPGALNVALPAKLKKLYDRIVASEGLQEVPIVELIDFVLENSQNRETKRQAFDLLSGVKGKPLHGMLQSIIDIAYSEPFEAPRVRIERLRTERDRMLKERKALEATRSAVSQDTTKWETEEGKKSQIWEAEAAKREGLLGEICARLRTTIGFLRSRSSEMTSKRPWDAFLSYAFPDRSIARRLFLDFGADRRVFYDEFCLAPGVRWREKIPEVQDQSKATIPLIGDATSSAHYQISEIERAINLHRATGHKIFPVLLTDVTQVPFGLEQFQAIRLQEFRARLRDRFDFLLGGEDEDAHLASTACVGTQAGMRRPHFRRFLESVGSLFRGSSHRHCAPRPPNDCADSKRSTTPD